MVDGHLGLGSDVQLGLVDFKVCYWPSETSLNWRITKLQNPQDPSWRFEPRCKWLIINFKIPSAI